MKFERLSCLLVGACLCVLAASGCVQINSSDSGSMNIAPKTVGPVDNYRPLYKVDESRKVSAESSVNNLFWIFTWGSDNAVADNAVISSGAGPFLARLFPFLAAKETAAKAAFYKACQNARCDSIVAARYEITTTDYLVFKKVSVQLSGFPATLTGVEAVKPMPYYIDGSGKIVTLDKVVAPLLLFDARKVGPKDQKSGGIFGFLNKLFFGE